MCVYVYVYVYIYIYIYTHTLVGTYLGHITYMGHTTICIEHTHTPPLQMVATSDPEYGGGPVSRTRLSSRQEDKRP